MKNLKTMILLMICLMQCHLLPAQAQTWQEMKDSTQYYKEAQDFETALKWARLAVTKAETEFGKLDTLYGYSLGELAELEYYNGHLDSALFYQDLQQKNYRYNFPNDNTNLASAINNMGFFLNQSGDQDQAELYFIEALDMRRRLYKGDHPDLASSIDQLASLYNTMRNFSKAEPLLKESLEMSRRLYSGDSPQLATAITNSALFYQGVAKYEEAEKLFNEALIMSRRLYKGDNVELATSITNVGLFYEEIGRFDEAERLFLEGLDMTRRLYKGDHPDLAHSINAIGLFYYQMGDMTKAESYFKEALAMNRRLYRGDHPELARLINNMAAFYQLTGRYSNAEPLLKEALEMRRRIYKGDHPDLASTLTNLANFYFQMGEYSKAEPLFVSALDMNRKLYNSDNPELAKSIKNLGGFYATTGNFKDAEKLQLEALEMTRRLFKGDHPYLARTINSIGNLYFQKKEDDKAKSYFTESLDMFRRIFKTDHPELAGAINNLAALYHFAGDYAEAEKLFVEALEIARRIYKGDHQNIAHTLNNLALLYNRTGNYLKADTCINESMEILKKLYNAPTPDLFNSINNKALFLNERGNLEEAEPYFKEASQMCIKITTDYFPTLSEKEKKFYWNTISKHFEYFNTFAIKRAIENPLIICDLYNTRLFSKALLLSSTNKIKSRIMNSGDSLLINQYREWCDLKESLIAIYKLTKEEIKSRNINIDSIENLANTYEKKLSLRSEQFAQSYEKKKVSWKSIQALLKPDEAAVEVVRYRYFDNIKFTDTIYYAFLIVTEQTEEHPEFVVLEKGNQLENDYYSDYRAKIDEKIKDTLSFMRYWSKLNDKIKNFKKIYFSGDGIYNKLNPETLMLPDGRYILDLQNIQQVNSTRDLLIGYYKTKSESTIYNSAVLIGNPNFSMEQEKVREISRKLNKEEPADNINTLASTRGITLKRLPGTEREIKDIENFLKKKNWVVKSYIGDMAVKSSVKAVNSPRVLHIATHGLFLQDINRGGSELFGFEEQKMTEEPLLRSGLFFSGVNNYLLSNQFEMQDSIDNGLLTAFEAINLNLDRTELVVLSACETGLGEIQNGEGVFGLRSAFQQAGARSVLMSLWKVNDKATQELMSNFYKYWITGLSKRDAFAKAQQEVRKNFKAPFYWGAFVMVGE